MSKKIAITILILSMLLSSICFATEELPNEINDSENTVYIDNYEDYEDLINGTSGYSQEELKDYYNEYQDYIMEYYNSYEREETYKARVIEVEDVEEQYEFNDYYYSVSKYEIQPITVEILEGDYKGQTFDIDYILTGDSLNNIQYSSLQKGDIIFVAVNLDQETGETYADITNAGSNVERFGIIICLGVVALLLLIIYGGKKGVITALISLLILDFCLIIIPNMGYMGAGFILGGVLLIALLIILISLSELGINQKALKAMIIATVLTFVSALLLVTADYLTRTVGITFETAAVAENVLLGNMNFEHLYIIITLIISSLAITNIVCKAMMKLSKENVNNFNEGIKACENILNSNILHVVITLMALYIPNHLLLLTNKYTASEIWNSEILISELIRLFVILITMALAVPTVVTLNDKKEEK